ncbi:MAG: glucuronide permease [Subdoligranulum sp.]|nr:glucuronide permease [Subdoligranulum sp.]
MATDISKYQGANGIHRVPIWRIGGFALNNTATNLYLVLMGYVAFYLGGFVGMATVLASSFSMIMRLWDGVTDPFIGFLVDKTNGKFGKNRPFMVIGQVILCITSFILFHVTHLLPENAVIRSAFFVIVSMIYYIGYTFQCVVTKSAQSCLTNDPKQRPLFAVFDAIYNTALFAGMAVVAANVAAKYDPNSSYVTLGFFHEMWVIVAIISAVFTAIAVFCIAPKDRVEFFGTGKAVKVSLKDYWDTLKHNRAIQMLVVSASTDKLANQAKTSSVTAVMFGVVTGAGSLAISAAFQGMTSIPTVILAILVIGGLATTLGQRKGMIIGSAGGIVTSLMLIAMWVFGDPTTMVNSQGAMAMSAFTIILVVLTIINGAFNSLSGNIVIPMTADCADYEVYRTGKYVPGMMGTLFSFVDKIVSSFAPMIAGLLFAAIGFKDIMPDASAPYSDSLKFVGLFLMYGLIIVGQICNLVAMKFYPLTKEKMEEIRGEIEKIKAEAMKE